MANKRLIFLACNIYSILAEYSLRRCTFRWGLWPMGLWLRYSVITKAALRSLLCIFLQWCFDGNLVFITILAFLRKFLSLVNDISLLTISPPDRLVSNRAGAQKKQKKTSCPPSEASKRQVRTVKRSAWAFAQSDQSSLSAWRRFGS